MSKITAREAQAHRDLIALLDAMTNTLCTWDKQNAFSPEPDEGCDEDRVPGTDRCARHPRETGIAA